MSLRRLISSFLIAVLALLGAASAGPLWAQEHPEHPEHPTDKPKAEGVSMADLADAITDYVKKDAVLKGGFFLVYDTEDKAPLALTLDRVHTERLSRVGDETYFACADFKTADGTVYDLDVFMKGKGKKSLQVTEVTVHKKMGAERYTWFEEGGIWQKKPVKAGN
jgi:hypothetical protein